MQRYHLPCVSIFYFHVLCYLRILRLGMLSRSTYSEWHDFLQHRQCVLHSLDSRIKSLLILYVLLPLAYL